MDHVRARLADLIDADGASYAALSRMLRRNAAYLQQFVRRGTPRLLAERDRKLLAAYFRIDESELGAGSGPVMPQIRWLNLEASAGAGAIPGDEGAGGALQLDPRLIDALRLDPARAAMLRAKGDSMAPTIEDGDHIVLDERDRTVSARSGIFVLRREGDLLVKRVAHSGRAFRVVSDNPDYPPWEAPSLDIVGRVVWLSRALR